MGKSNALYQDFVQDTIVVDNRFYFNTHDADGSVVEVECDMDLDTVDAKWECVIMEGKYKGETIMIRALPIMQAYELKQMEQLEEDDY
tara:strand:+ start:633 stop:896 length:264 start_codon:yes stop_codon:yes gene_type:complete